MTTEITKYDDVIDSRDVIARIEELENERSELVDAVEEAGTNDAVVEWDNSDEAHELATLRALADEAEGYSGDWKYGATLVRDSYFETYAQEFAEEIGAIPDNAQWPCTCIDWEQAARELQMDYTSVEFDGVTYWVR